MSLRLPTEWERVGRGHELQFYATDEEVKQFLDDTLRLDSDLLVLVATATLPKTGGVQRVEDVSSVVDAVAAGMWQFWIAPATLSEDLKRIPRATPLDACFSASGLVLFQHGLTHKGRRTSSRIAIASRSRAVATGEEIEATTMLRLFTRLKRRIQDDLRYSTVKVFPNGSRVVDSTRTLMTAGACAAAAAGFFDMECGLPIDSA